MYFTNHSYKDIYGVTSPMTLSNPLSSIDYAIDNSSSGRSGEYKNRADMARSIYVCLVYLMPEVKELNDPDLVRRVRQSIDVAERIIKEEPDNRI